MYFNNSIVTHKIEIFENIYQIAYCMIFIVGILYILLLIYKVGHHESIDLKKNTGLLFGIVFMDLVLYGFFITCFQYVIFVIKYKEITIILLVYINITIKRIFRDSKIIRYFISGLCNKESSGIIKKLDRSYLILFYS